ncbi:MAG TPA: DUF2306 domain-containing protein [Gemmatimonadaceae bacterium]|nr:DUF2306 domain-containing protein [Gemmatimonadaceae bacterium]
MERHDDDHPVTQPTRRARAIVILLVVIGVAAGVARAVFPDDLASRAEPLRRRLLSAARAADPFAERRAAELASFDGRFAAHPVATLVHVVPGSLFLLLAPFQFSSRIRRRYACWHRWAGRLLVTAGLASGLAGLFFGLRMPYGGAAEAAAVATFGGLFLVALVKAVVAIRRREVGRHRDWMVRAFAAAVGVSTVRVVAAALDVVLTPAGVPPRTIFVLSLWTGWALSVAAAELWLRRGHRDVLPSAAPIAAAAATTPSGAAPARAPA